MKFIRNTLVGLLVAASAIVSLTGPASAQIVAIGASNTQGYGVSSSEAWPAQLEAMLRAKGKPYSVSNRGIYGSTTSEVMARLDSDVPAGTRIVVSGVAAFNDMRVEITYPFSQVSMAQHIAYFALPYFEYKRDEGLTTHGGQVAEHVNLPN